MPIENNIELGSGQIYFKGVDGLSEPIDISDGEITCEDEWADEHEPIKIRNVMEATLECESMEINREWTLAYCKECRQPFPITRFDALICGTTGWTCPLCTMINRLRDRRDA